MGGNRFGEYFELPDRTKVGYSLKKRGRWFVVRFIGPDGKYARESTGERELTEARTKAARVVLRRWCPTTQARPITWSELEEKLRVKLTLNNNRHETLRDYLKTIHVLRATLPETRGPLDITDDLAQRFKADYVTTPYVKAKGPDASQYYRTHRTLAAYLRKCRSLWNKWLTKEFKLTKDNPWLRISDPALNKWEPRVPEESVFLSFLRWVREKYAGWDMPSLLIEFKAYCGGRLLDLCGLRSYQLSGGHLHFTPDQMKAREKRDVPLPPELAARLNAIKAPDYLWGRYPEQLAAYWESRFQRCGRLNVSFEPSAVYWFVQSLFRDYNATHAVKITSHDLRRRAVTLAYRNGLSTVQAGLVCGMSEQTAARYYRAIDEQNEIESGFAKVGDTLMLRA